MPRPIQTKELTVHFFVVKNLDGHEGAFPPGEFPWMDVIESIMRLDPASPDYRTPGDLFGNTEHFCHILIGDDDAPPLICAYTKELVAAPETEHKGEIRTLEFDEDEGVVDGAYLMFFPGDIVAMLRTSAKAPGRAVTARWLSIFGGVPFYLAPLPDPAVQERLARGGLLRKVLLKARPSQLRTVDSGNSFAETMRAIAESRPHCDVIEYSASSTKRVKSTPQFSNALIDDLNDLLALTPQLEQAKVWTTLASKPVNLLLNAHHTCSISVPLNDRHRVGPRQAAEALLSAYDRERPRRPPDRAI